MDFSSNLYDYEQITTCEVIYCTLAFKWIKGTATVQCMRYVDLWLGENRDSEAFGTPGCMQLC